MRRIALLVRLLPLCLLAALSGCTTWESLHIFSSAPKHPPTELTEIKTTLTVRPLWNVSIGKADKFFFSPALAGDYFYTAAADGNVYKFELASGKQTWKIDAGQKLSAGVGADASTLAVVTTTGDLLVFEADGKQRWKASLGGEVLSAPLVAQGVVVVRTTDGRFYGYDAGTGRRRWTYTRQPQPLVLRSAPAMESADGMVYAGLPGGRLVALSLVNGAVRWEISVAVPKGATELERVADVMGKPVVSNREVCVASFQGRASCVDVSSGNIDWARDLSSTTGIAVDPRFAFVTDENSLIQAFARSGGTSVWKNDKIQYRAVSAPVSVGRAIAVGDYKGFVHWLSREDGSLIARASTDGTAIEVAPQLFSVGGSPAVLFQTSGGGLYAYASE